MSWRHELRMYLIRSGTIGLTMTEILHLFKNNVTTHELNAELEAWRSEEKAQKFKKPSNRGRPIQLWRATTKMIEDDDTKGEEDD